MHNVLVCQSLFEQFHDGQVRVSQYVYFFSCFMAVTAWGMRVGNIWVVCSMHSVTFAPLLHVTWRLSLLLRQPSFSAWGRWHSQAFNHPRWQNPKIWVASRCFQTVHWRSIWALVVSFPYIRSCSCGNWCSWWAWSQVQILVNCRGLSRAHGFDNRLSVTGWEWFKLFNKSLDVAQQK